MERYISIRYSKDYNIRMEELYRDLVNEKIDEHSAYLCLRQLEMPKEMLTEMSIVHSIFYEISSYKKAPKGGVWLKKVVDYIKPNYYFHNINIEKISVVSYFKEQLAKKTSFFYKDYQKYIVSENKEKEFWEIIELVEKEINGPH